ncbi:MAG: hypothetical protein WAS90_04810 [Brachymonas denitrificans]
MAVPAVMTHAERGIAAGNRRIRFIEERGSMAVRSMVMVSEMAHRGA